VPHVRSRPIAPHVESFSARTPTLPPATHTESYALGEREVLLVEPATPYDDEAREWLAWARGFESVGRRVVGVFATHHHPDHVGGAELFARELGAPLVAHRETARLCPRLSVERTLDDGEVVTLAGPEPTSWRALHTPGHAPGHVCLVDEATGVAVVGDMVASEGTIVIDPYEGNMAEYLRQLERLAALGLRLALPAHGAPIHEPTAHFQHYVRHRLAREAKVLAALGALEVELDAGLDARLGAGPDGVDEARLVSSAYDDAPVAIHALARLSLLAHLVKLERDGRVRRAGDGWRVDANERAPV
jgi:ribonuclease/clavin/mitogillin